MMKKIEVNGTLKVKLLQPEGKCPSCGSLPGPESLRWGVKEEIEFRYVDPKNNNEYHSKRENIVIKDVSLYEAQAVYIAVMANPNRVIEVEVDDAMGPLGK